MPDIKPPLQGYALWLVAEEKEQQSLQQLVDQLANSYKTHGFSAHATLLGLLDKTWAEVDEIKKISKDIANSFSGIAAEIVGVGMRQIYFQSVFLPVVPATELVAMNLLARKLLAYKNDPPFMPHWSMVYGDLDEATKKAIVNEIINQRQFPHVVPIRQLALVDVHGYPNEWKVIEQYPLAASL